MQGSENTSLFQGHPAARLLQQLVRVTWAPISVVALHSALSLMFGHHREFDPLFHFSGGVAGAYCLLQFINHFPARVPAATLRHQTPVVIGLVAVATLLWELMEFASDQLLGTHIQHGPADTWGDVALGITGAAVCATVAIAIRRRRAADNTRPA